MSAPDFLLQVLSLAETVPVPSETVPVACRIIGLSSAAHARPCLNVVFLFSDPPPPSSVTFHFLLTSSVVLIPRNITLRGVTHGLPVWRYVGNRSLHPSVHRVGLATVQGLDRHLT